MTIVAIHQPNFFPWLGYFEKIARADKFIFLDNVQLPKTGGCWSNRVKLLIAGEARWVTAPIDRSYSGVRLINEINFKERDLWQLRVLKSIHASYQSHPFYSETMAVVEPLLLNPRLNIADYNIEVVTQIALRLGVGEGKFCRASDFSAEGSASALLCALVKQVKGDVYMCGGGAEDYQENDLFKRQGLQLLYQNFSHPIYSQKHLKTFVPRLSIIDALMNLGWVAVKALIKKDNVT